MGGAVNAVTDVLGIGDGAEGAARAQEAEARAQLRFAKETQQKALDIAQQGITPNQLRSQGRAIDIQLNNVRRQRRLFNALDPAILEASEQALGILQGKQSQFLAPVRQQRDQQRKRLLDTLREQLGPGAETSTAGIQALTKFDLETSNAVAGQQQQSLSQLFGIGQSGAAGRNAFGANIGQLGSMAAQARGQQIGALTNTTGAVSQAGQDVVGSAGSAFAGDVARENFIGGLVQAGTGAAIGGLTGKGK